MYKVHIKTLEELKMQLIASNELINLLNKGKKIHPTQVEDILSENENMIKLLNDNYLKPKSNGK